MTVEEVVDVGGDEREDRLQDRGVVMMTMMLTLMQMLRLVEPRLLKIRKMAIVRAIDLL